MILYVRRIRRTFHEASTRQKFAIFGITVIVIWISGFFDKLSETSYDEFSWPSEPDKNAQISKFTQFPKCKFSSVNSNQILMIIVKSSVKNWQMRESVRKTWGRYRLEGGIEVMPVFVIGRIENSEIMRRAEKEAEEFGDILSISSIDSYRNNTLKLFAALDYSINPRDCSVPDFVFLVDDDYMVHIPNLVKNAASRNGLIYEGFVFDTTPFRLKIHKHCISLDEYPFSRYPPYVSAGAVFLTSATVKLFQNSIRSLKTFPFDDVFTGILAKTVHVQPVHNENFVFWTRKVSRKEWDEGVIAAHGFARKDLEYEYTKVFG